ncbi:MAG: hypothetical protein KIT84_37185 [Labilithrix sp.]|nr:hypothetical protein [Labilithrix sp.]MCW5816693.1 hypothetical protein [Labilithrix sp.]
MAYSLVLPFHSDLTSIGKTVTRARAEGGAHGVEEVLLAHNGRPLDAAARAEIETLVAPAADGRPEVRLLDTTATGIGAGYKVGIRHARAEFVVLSADDLPFGWSDLAAFERAGSPDFAIGSKAHPDSERPGESRTISRRVSSFGFLFLRRLLLGWSTPGDSQGSLIVRTEVARSLLPDLRYDHYLSSLEIVTLHLERGGSIVEVPIAFEYHPHASSVSVVRDGLKMARELVDLRGRVRAERRG